MTTERKPNRREVCEVRILERRAGRAGREWLVVPILAVLGVLGIGSSLSAQTRLAVLQAEDRRAPTANDLAVLRSGARSGDPQVARAGVRALGRLERPTLIIDLLPLLRSANADVRAEAANAIGQAAAPWKSDPPKSATATLDGALAGLAARLRVESDTDVRAALSETIGRLPYVTPTQVDKADQVLVDMAMRAESVTDRLGVAKAFEALVRISRKLRPPSADAQATLKQFVTPNAGEATGGARVRRLALEALITGGLADEPVVAAALKDPDSQVRRIAARGAKPEALRAAVHDESPIVRIEALRQLTARKSTDICAAAEAAAADRELQVALVALDQLAGCGNSPEAIALLDRVVADMSDAGSLRGWHRAAHALLSLASASPEHGAAVLPQFTNSAVWQLRMYGARAAASLQNREVLESLATRDEDDNVREAAVDAVRRLYGHDADRVYIAQLMRSGYQILRAAAVALADTPNRDSAVPALRSALERLLAEKKDNSHDARKAIATTLTGLGESVNPSVHEPFTKPGSVSDLNADDLRRLASPRARITMRGIGTFELALFTIQAPATVLRFARLASAGYFNGLTFHRVVPNFVIQGGSPGANEYIGDSPFMRDELGLWPHVRGAVGISTRGRDTGDAQIFVDLVDNPRLDHDYTVFAQVLNGIDVVDRILEGDVIERVEIIP
jgi:cyclophilin family peptidyl-prolyl cis-trans isomerase/HEAT repeat protein